MKLQLTLAMVTVAVLALALYVLTTSRASGAAEPSGGEARGPDPMPGGAPSPDAGPARAVTSTPPPPTDAKPPRPKPIVVPGTIRARVRDKDDRPVAALVVLLRKRDRLASKATDEDGMATFGSLAPDEYRLEVEPGSIPHGYLPPFDQDRTVHYQDHLAAGYFGRQVEIAGTGDEHTVDLRVFLPASFDGHLLGPEGEPIADGHVRLQSRWAGLESLVGDAMTDANGYFSMPAVYPGEYSTEVHFGLAHAYSSVPRPKMERVSLADGEHQTRTLRMVRGKWSLVGRVVDDEGAPFAGIDVTCDYWNDANSIAPGYGYESAPVAITRTSDSGEYVFEGLPDQLVIVRAGLLGYEPPKRPGVNVIATLPTPVKFDGAVLTGRIEAPDIVARRSRPFVVAGQVEVDSAWLEKNGLRQRDVSVCARAADGKETRVDLAKDWRFEWWCETPCDPVELVAVAKRRSTVLATARSQVTPNPNGRMETVLRIP